MMTVILLYVLCLVLFLARSILRVQDHLFCLNTSRSRETKAMSKKQLRREIKCLLLSPLWPVLVIRAIKDIVVNRETLLSINNG